MSNSVIFYLYFTDVIASQFFSCVKYSNFTDETFHNYYFIRISFIAIQRRKETGEIRENDPEFEKLTKKKLSLKETK